MCEALGGRLRTRMSGNARCCMTEWGSSMAQNENRACDRIKKWRYAVLASVAAVAGGGPFYRPGCEYHVIAAAASVQVETKRSV